MNRRTIAIILASAAFALGASLLRYSHDNILTFSDGHVAREQASDPVVTLFWSVSDLHCFQKYPVSGNDYPCKLQAGASVRGLYAREGVQRLAAIIFGVTLPILLLITAAAFMVQNRWAYILGLCAAALTLNLCLTVYGNDFVQTHSDGRVEHMLAGDAIHVTRVENGVDNCMDRSPCRRGTYAFVTGLYAVPGVPRLLAIFGGLAAPVLLLMMAIGLAVRPRLLGYT